MDTIHNDGIITYNGDTYEKEKKCDDAKVIENLGF